MHQKEALSYLKIDGKDRKVPDFILTNQDSLFISNDDLLGKVYVLEFFFSRCPDICIEMNRNMKKLDKVRNQNLFNVFPELINLKKKEVWDSLKIKK